MKTKITEKLKEFQRELDSMSMEDLNTIVLDSGYADHVLAGIDYGLELAIKLIEPQKTCTCQFDVNGKPIELCPFCVEMQNHI